MKLINPPAVIFCLFISLVISCHVTASPISSDELFKNQTYSNFKISPDGEYVSLHFRDKKEQFISLVDRKSNKMITSIPFGYDYRLKRYHWINNQTIYFSFNAANIIAKYENETFKFYNVATSGFLVDTFDESSNKVMFAKRHGYNRVYYRLFIIEVDDLIRGDFGDAREVEHNLDDVRYYHYDAKRKLVFTRTFNKKKESVTYKYMPLDGGIWKDVITIKESDYDLSVFSFMDKDSVAVITNKDTDKMVLRKYNIEKQEFGDIIYQHPSYDLSNVSFTIDGELDSVAYTEHGLTKTLYFHKGKEKIKRKLSRTFKNKEAYITDTTEDEKLSILYVNGSDEPGEYFIYENNSNVLHRLDVSYPKLANETFSPSQVLKVNVADGVEIEAFLTLPQDVDHSTLLVMPHGGPIAVKESDRFNKRVQYFASRGFAVLRVNFRGSAGFGKAFQNQGVGEFGQLIEEDITAVVNQIIKKHQFKHMCSIGASYGGYSAAMLAIKHPDEYDCVISSFGIFDLPLLFNASNYRSDEEYRKHIAKVVGEFNEGMVQQSPFYLFKQLKAPILLLAGRDDNIADFEHTNRFNYVLKKSGHPVESFFYKNTGHGHRTWSGDKHEAAVSYDFLMRTLKLSQKDLTKKERQAIGNDYSIIADKYNFDDEIEDDFKKAIQYYIKAADFEDSRSNFNVGSYYHVGKEVELNLDKAVEYYQRAADLGYAEAYSRLGRMYMLGEHLTQDWNKALENLTKAQELDANPTNNVMLARFYCTAPEKLRDVDRCIELMETEQYKRQSSSTLEKAKDEIRTAMAWIIIAGKLNDSERKKIKSYTKRTFKLKQFEFDLEDLEAGTFKLEESDKFGRASEYVAVRFGEQVSISDSEDKGWFGIKFDTDVSGIDLHEDKVALVYRWISQHTERETGDEHYYMLYGSPKGGWRIFYPFENIKSSSVWKLEVYDLNGKQIYMKEFNVVKREKTQAKITNNLEHST